MRSGLILGMVITFLISCKPSSNTSTYVKLQGRTMGTSYHITCSFDDPEQLQDLIESHLKEVNIGMNTYDPNSLISKFNQSEKGMSFQLDNNPAKHFFTNTLTARKIVKETNGYFDPTVGPLVNYWGFGSVDRPKVLKIDSLAIDSLMEFVSFNRIILQKEESSFSINKSNQGVYLDYSAIAKGYGVDVIADLLGDLEIENYLVEIGGETRLSGKNALGESWNLAISEPNIDSNPESIAKILSISNRSVATSGNYRNYYKVDDKIYSHTINPFTGYPERSNLLSATIIHSECMYADAYATACMAMGLERSLQFVNTHPEISYLFLYTDENGQLQSVDSADLTFLD